MDLRMRLPFRKSDDKKPLFRDVDKDNLRWFWHGYLKDKTPWLLLVFVLIILQGVVYQQFLSLTEDGLRLIFDQGDLRDLAQVCAMVFGVFAFRGVMSYVVPRVSIWIASNAVQKMRDDITRHLISLDLEFFERTATGDVILRAVHQTQALSQFVGQQTVKVCRDIATVTILSGYLFYKQPILFLSAAAVLPVIILLMQSISGRIKPIQAQMEAANAHYMNTVDEMVSGMRTVKISGQEQREQQRIFDATGGIRDLMIRLQASQAMVLPYIDFAAAFVYVLVIGGGGYMVLSPDFDVDGAAIITFLVGLVLIFDPGRRIAQFYVSVQAALILLDSIRSYYREKPTIFDKLDADEEFDALGDIELKNVSFSYTPETPLFDDLSLTFGGGKTTAIVGPTGSGKTTILSLLGRLYEPEKGTVSIGGKLLEDIKIASLRGSFSVVAQDIVIFNNTLLENVRYVKRDATDDEVWAAAEAAELADLIRERGDQKVGPKGSQLSGGQKQRIAIARAFLRDAPIVLLDEATSALDQRTEERVKVALGRLAKGKTTIMVAHRLSSVIDADQIFVLEAGQLAEAGSHDELLAKGGLYASLFEAQKKGYEP